VSVPWPPKTRVILKSPSSTKAEIGAEIDRTEGETFDAGQRRDPAGVRKPLRGLDERDDSGAASDLWRTDRL
jgi:hypothetical protein